MLSEKIKEQLSVFKKGFQELTLSRPATIGDGITRLNSSQEDHFISLYESSDALTEKFVPASGAASRMFKDLLALKNGLVDAKVSSAFFDQSEKLPFEISSDKSEGILEEIFDKLGYDKYPKGLLPFHEYPEGVRTAADEHLYEAIAYLIESETLAIHFTVSPDHEEKFKEHLGKITSHFSQKFNITFSTQDPSTNTVSVDLKNEPVLDSKGNYMLRPAGHGALLQNLSDRESDIIFIKNIDNVVPDRIKPDTIRFKKVLAGMLLEFQEKTFELLTEHQNGKNIIEQGKKLLAEMGTLDVSEDQIVQRLNRPIRVCGMVKNTGEPGGGPFWILKNDEKTLQIVEDAQVNNTNSQQDKIFKSSTHFNPVDLVCGLKTFEGGKFDLMKYSDFEMGIITEKSHNGQPIKAMELPGLWNGCMADWNTFFVEVPISTSNPVKTVMDLLRPEHQV